MGLIDLLAYLHAKRGGVDPTQLPQDASDGQPGAAADPAAAAPQGDASGSPAQGALPSAVPAAPGSLGQAPSAMDPRSLPQLQPPQPSALGALGQTAENVAALPLNILNSIGSKFADLPKRYQAAEQMRALDLQQKRLQGAMGQIGLLAAQRRLALADQMSGGDGGPPAATPAPGPMGLPTLPAAGASPAPGAPALPTLPGAPTVSGVTVTAVPAPAPARAPSTTQRWRNALAAMAVVDDKPNDAWGITKGDFAQGADGTLYDKTDGSRGQRLPNPVVVNDRVIDTGDPANRDRFFGKPPAPGAEPVYNRQGDEVGWRMADGSIQAITAAAAADAYPKKAAEAAYAGSIAGAQEAAKAPYTPVKVDQNGVPTTISAAQLPGLTGSPRGGGVNAASLPQLPPGVAAAGRQPLPPARPGTAAALVAGLPKKGAPSLPTLPAPGVPALPALPGGAPGIRGVNPADQKRLADLRKQADQMGIVAGMAQDFMKLNGGTSTGPVFDDLDVPIPFAHKSVNLNVLPKLQEWRNPSFQAMESITSRAAPLLRPEGSGRIMQSEYGNFLQSFPNVRNTGEANQNITGQLQSEAQNRRSYANFMGDYLAQHGALTGADEAWQAQQKAAQPKGAAAKVFDYDPKTGQIVERGAAR
jgi:hypothetical protein